MRSLLIAAVVFSTVIGCTSTRLVGPHGPKSQYDSLDYAELQQRIEQRAIAITLRDGRTYSAYSALVSADSTRFVDESDRRILAVATSDVLKIEKTDHWGGALGGFFSGAIAGGFLGWAHGSMTAHGDMRGLGIGFSTVGGAFIGAIAGLLFGGIHGVVSVYEFDQPSREDRDPSRVDAGTP